MDVELIRYTQMLCIIGKREFIFCEKKNENKNFTTFLFFFASIKKGQEQ